MNVIKDFDAWLDAVGVERESVEYGLLPVYRTVNGEVGYGYELKPAKGNTSNVLLYADGYEDVLLLTPKSKDAFLKHLDRLAGELGVEGQAAFEHSMTKND